MSLLLPNHPCLTAELAADANCKPAAAARKVPTAGLQLDPPIKPRHDAPIVFSTSSSGFLALMT